MSQSSQSQSSLTFEDINTSADEASVSRSPSPEPKSPVPAVPEVKKKFTVGRKKTKVKVKAPEASAAPDSRPVTPEGVEILPASSRSCSPENKNKSKSLTFDKLLDEVSRCESAGLSVIEQSLTESKVICAEEGITSEHRVKQLRLFISARDSGLHQEVLDNRKGVGIMSRAGLEHFDMIVTLADKKDKKSRNARVPLACNARMSTGACGALTNLLNIDEPLLVAVMKEYDFRHYEKATALYNSQVRDERLDEFFKTEFLNGFLFTAEGASLIEQVSNDMKPRARKVMSVASVTASAKKMSAEDRKALIAALLAADE